MIIMKFILAVPKKDAYPKNKYNHKALICALKNQHIHVNMLLCAAPGIKGLQTDLFCENTVLNQVDFL